MKVYVSGPMSGYPDLNYPAFEAAAVALRAAGYEVISPHEVNPVGVVPPAGVEDAWAWYLKRDIAAMMEADAVAVIDGYTTSLGSIVEVTLAHKLGMPVLTLNEALGQHTLDVNEARG